MTITRVAQARARGRRAGGGGPGLRLWAIPCLLLVLIVLAPTAAGHAYLASSTPPPGGTVPEATTVLALRFTEQLDPSQVGVRLIGPNATPLDASAEVPPSRPTEMRVETEPLAPGAHRLSWRVLSVDGHVEAGALWFNVGPGEPREAGFVDASGQGPGLLDVAEGGARTLLWAGVLAAIGLPLFLSEVVGATVVPARIPRVLAALLGGSLLGAAGLLWLLVHALEAGWPAALSTRAGTLLLLQGLLAAVTLAITVAAARDPGRQRGRLLLLAVLPAALVVVINSMGGHGVVAFASREAVAGHIAATVHVLVTGLWAGGVLGFLLLRDLDGPSLAEVIERFFPVGVLSVVVLAATGLYQAYVHLPELSDLWGSPYGWILLAKTGLLVLLVGFGAVHERWLGPRLARGAASPGGLRRLLTPELIVLGLVVLLAGVLAATPLPRAPLEEGPGPLATFEQEAATEDFWVHIAFDQATLKVSQAHELSVELRPRTSLGTEEVEVRLALAGPGPDGSERAVVPERTGASAWTADPLSFDEAGSWTLTVHLMTPAGDQNARFTIPVDPTG